jgi:hypothetical protein
MRRRKTGRNSAVDLILATPARAERYAPITDSNSGSDTDIRGVLTDRIGGRVTKLIPG